MKVLFHLFRDLVVVVSTANLVPPGTSEGTWIQRFQKRKSHKTLKEKDLSNDFGFRMKDFLERLSKSCEKMPYFDHVVNDFLKEYVDPHFSLDKLPVYYRFEKATVHLIPTVVGKFEHNDERFGRRRVQSILQELKDHPDGTMNVPIHKNDELVMVSVSIFKLFACVLKCSFPRSS